MRKVNVKQMAERLQDIFGRKVTRVAKKTGFVKRQSKVTGRLFLKTLLCGFMKSPEASLADLVGVAEELQPGLALSAQGLDQRINEAGLHFVQQMLSLVLRGAGRRPGLPVDVLQHFAAVYLIDSTSFQLPAVLADEWPGSGGDASKAALKVLLCLEYLTGCYHWLEAVAGTRSDQKLGQTVVGAQLTKGSLSLFDLGFFSLPLLQAVVAAEAFFLCRLQHRLHLWVREAAGPWQPWDLDRFLQPRDLLRGEVDVRLGADLETSVECRLILARVPPAVAAARRRRARKAAQREGRTVSRRYLRRLDFTLLVTNVAPSVWPTATVLAVYPLRWQVELTFKLWKSGLRLAVIRGQRKERILIEIYAKLILLLLFSPWLGLVRTQQYSADGREVSVWKAWKYLRRRALSLWRARDRQALAAGLRSVSEHIQRRCLTTRRQQQPSTLDRLQAAAQFKPVIETVAWEKLQPFLGRHPKWTRA